MVLMLNFDYTILVYHQLMLDHKHLFVHVKMRHYLDKVTIQQRIQQPKDEEEKKCLI
jgi:hypothetical protein